MSATAVDARYEEQYDEEPRLLDTDATGPKSSLWWGFVGLITIEIVVFGTFIVSYFYYQANQPGWPPEDPPSLLLPTINSFVLLGSSISIYIADKGIQKGSQTRLRAGLVASILFAILFLVLKWMEFAEKSYRWDEHSYGSIVWTMLGLHALHVCSVLLKSIVMAVLAFRGFFSERNYLGIDVNGLYWHFVVVIWIPIYLTIYISPRLGS